MKPEEITKLLDSYIEWDKPDYAIMLTGGWGTGKTYFIKDYIERKHIVPHRRKIIYLSLYGIESESEIEKQVWLQIAQSSFSRINKWRKENKTTLWLLLFFLFCVFIAAMRDFGIERTVRFALSIIGTTSLVGIVLWIYDILKISILQKTLSNVGLIVFDDFERAEMSHGKLLAYINRYVEHFHKHVVVVCNESEIKDNPPNYGKEIALQADVASDSIGQERVTAEQETNEINNNTTPYSSFKKIQEKVFGKTIVLKQNVLKVIHDIGVESQSAHLKNIIDNNHLGFEWFVSVTTPQINPVNYRVWKRCCRDFESTFGVVNPVFFNDITRVKSLIGQFFPIVYCIQIHDFGNGLIFPQDSIDNISYRLYQSNGSFKWIKDLFPHFHWDYVLPKEIWNAIIFNHHVEPEIIESYWKEITCTKNAFYETINNFYHKTDLEIDHAWNELKDAFEKRTIKNVKIIIQVFVAFLDMISKQCCPTDSIVFLRDKTDKNVYSSKKVFAWMRLYCQNLQFDIKHTYDFSRSFYYMVYADRLNENDKDLLKKCLEYMYRKIDHYCRNMLPSETYQKLLKTIENSRDDEALFYQEWNNNNFDSENVFSHQNPALLLQALLELPMAEFGVRFHTVLRSMRESTLSKSESYVLFKKEYIICIQNMLSNKDIHLDRARKTYLRYAIESLTKDLSQDEDESVHNNVPSASTDKEPEQ